MENYEFLHAIKVTWRGNRYLVETNPDASLKNLGDELIKLTSVKPDTMRLIVPQISGGSKLFYPYSKEHSELSLQETSIFEGKSKYITMMGVSEDEVEEVQKNAKDHLKIAGFDDEERRMRLRMSSRSTYMIKLPQGPYTFSDFRTLQLPGIELNPPASEALKRMHMLAADPGIVAIMNKHRWRVGIMTEMAPVGYVGVSPECILGFNKNYGEEISLRLRTDDLKGFRKYESIKKTLLHELAHMVFSEHDANFFALNKQLNEEAAKLDWTKSRGHTLGAVRNLDYDEEDYDGSDKKYSSQKLGGNVSDQSRSARASAVAAAHRRSTVTYEINSDVSGVHEQPSSALDERHDKMDYVREANITDESSLKDPLKKDYEPNPDVHACDRSNCEPDPDDSHSQVTDPLNSGMSLSMTIDEPDPDDLEAKQIKSLGRHIHLLEHNNFLMTESTEGGAFNIHKELEESGTNSVAKEEPDPDDYLMPTQQDSEMEIDESMAIAEAYPDDSEAKKINSGNGCIYRHDRNNALLTKSMEEPASSFKPNEEPDPDESHANGVSEDEPDPENCVAGSRDISNMTLAEPDPGDKELQRIQDPVIFFCNKLKKAVEMLIIEANPAEASTSLQTLLKIIRNVIVHPNEIKFKRLRKANPIIQKNVAKFKGAMEILEMIGFVEDVDLDETGRVETCMVLKRNDPGLLWLAKSSLEGHVSC